MAGARFLLAGPVLIHVISRMPASSAKPAQILEALRFAGGAVGSVKALSGFKKSHHSVPDAVNAATTGFLAKLAAPELAEEGERYFQEARAKFGYKRKDLTLDLSPGAAVLSAKDFVLEITYALSESDPSEYRVGRALSGVRRADFLALPEAEQLFAGIFTDVVFTLTRGAPVEKVVDAIEGLEKETSALRVDYPSDCSTCTLTVPDVEAEVRFDGRELAIAFPRTGTPRELWESFLAVRHAFALTKDKTLLDLLAG